MKGSVIAVKGRRDTWDLRHEVGFEKDATGVRKRKQRSVRFHGTKAQADRKLRELVGAVETGQDVEPSKDALVDWLREWHRTYVADRLRPNTVRLYRMFIEEHVAKADVGLVQLQALRAPMLERFLTELATKKKLSASSMQVYSGIVRTALARAVKLRRMVVNVALDVDRPRAAKERDLRVHCWSAVEARRVLEYAKANAGPQLFAYLATALDSGCRKSELNGLAWSHIDFEKDTVRVERQLDTVSPPAFGPTKTCTSRAVPINGETVQALTRHRAAQAELKLKNRLDYHDLDLVFAKQWEDIGRAGARLGDPITSLSERQFQRLCDDAGVRRIKFHGTRHTCATLALGAGVPVHIVSKRLGHSSVSMTLDVYSHSLPDQSADATAIIAEVLWGRREPAAGESR